MAGTGFEPVGFVGNRQFTGALSKYWVTTAGSNAKIVYGQPVAMSTAGTVAAFSGASPVAGSFVCGIFGGCSYIDSTGNRQWSQSLPASLTAVGTYALVYDDPYTIFRARCTNGSNVDATSTIASIGSNALMDFTAIEIGSSGRSSYGVNITGTAPDGVNTKCFRIVGLTNDNVTVGTTTVAGTEPNPNFIATGSATFTHALVMFNPGVHFYSQGTGLA